MVDERPKRILCIDGGGMRALIPATVLLKLQEDWMDGTPVCETFDMIGGTSTGALVAAGIGILNFSPEQCIDSCKLLARKVFPPQGKARKLIMLGNSMEQYQASALEKALKQLCGDVSMSGNVECHHSNTSTKCKCFSAPLVFTVAARANLSPSPAYLFRSWKWNKTAGLPPGPSPNHQIPVWEAMKASASAPTYFKPHTLADDTVLVDGGLGFNNPTLLAIHEMEAQCERTLDQRDVVVSLGTGLEIFKQGNAGFAFWLGKDLIAIVTDTRKVHEDVDNLRKKQGFQYFRINPQYTISEDEDTMVTSRPATLQYYVENADQLLSKDPDLLAKMRTLSAALLHYPS